MGCETAITFAISAITEVNVLTSPDFPPSGTSTCSDCMTAIGWLATSYIRAN